MSENSSSLKEKTAKGLLWGGINNSAQQILNLVFGIFISRILTPSDYGMVGMLTIFSLMASTIQESGFTAALANKKEIKHEDYNAVFWFNVITGISLYIILFFLSPYIAQFYHTPELIPLSRYIFLGFVIASFGTAHNAWLFRQLKVKQKAIIQLTSLSLSGLTGVLLAVMGAAYWGIATQSLVYVASNSILFWLYSGWRPTLNIDLSPLKTMIGFSSKILLTNIVSNINNNMLSVVLGKFYTEKEVGLFNQANKWTSMGYSTIQGMISGVAQPVLRGVADDRERQCRVFRKMLRFTAFVSFPTLFGLSVIAPELITITITDKWSGSAVLMQILCIGGAFMPIQNLYTNLLISKGRSDLFMWNTIIIGCLQICSALICHPYGLRVMIIAYICINILWLAVWHYFVRKEIGLSLFSALKDILPFMGISMVCMGTALYASQFTENVYISAIIKIAVAAIMYILFMKLSGSVTFREAVGYILKKKMP